MLELLKGSVKNLQKEIEKKKSQYFSEDDSVGDFFDKSVIIQKVKLFKTSTGDRDILNVLVSLLYRLRNMTKFTKNEATEVFFALTQIFQRSNKYLKYLLHSALIELSQFADDSIIATSSLIKDINDECIYYKGSALKALVSVTDKSMLGSIERYMKQAIVHQYAPFASAALISAYMMKSPEIVKKWMSEVTQALESQAPVVSYHALGLLYMIRKNDKFALLKMISKYGKILNSPISIIFLIRMTTKLLTEKNMSDADKENSEDFKILFGFLTYCLNTRNDAVALEASRACIILETLPVKTVKKILSIFKHLINSTKSYNRFAAVRSLYDLLIKHNYLIEVIGKEVREQVDYLTGDTNKHVAMYGVMISFKLTTDNNIGRIMSTVTKYMKEFSDEFRIEIVKEIRNTACKFPKQSKVLLNTLENCLKEEGGVEFKSAVVGSMLLFLKKNSDVKEQAIISLCEYSEDCEFTKLSIKIIRNVGLYAKNCNNAFSVVRYMYNRLLVEKSIIRLAAIRCLARLACIGDHLKSNICTIFERFFGDKDEEVAIAVILYHRMLTENYNSLAVSYMCPDKIKQDWVLFNNAASNYLKVGDFSGKFTLEAYASTKEDLSVDLSGEGLHTAANKHISAENSTGDASDSEQFDDEAAYLDSLRGKYSKVEVLIPCGNLLSASRNYTVLSEEDTEYAIKARALVFQNHVVVEFHVKNTVQGQTLENVTFTFIPPDEFIIENSSSISKIEYGESAEIYYVLANPCDDMNLTGELADCVMKFRVRDVDSGVTYDDEYMVENFSILLGDYITEMETFNFNTEWKALGDENELNDTFLIPSFSDIKTAANSVINLLGMKVLNRNSKSHIDSSSSTFQLLGTFKSKETVACKLDFIKNPSGEGVVLNLFVRSSIALVSHLVIDAIE